MAGGRLAVRDLERDIEEQPEVLLANGEPIRRAHAECRSWVGEAGRVVMTGMATSFYAWHSAGIVLRDRPATIIEASEYLHYARPTKDARPLLILSRSGESAEIVALLDAIDRDRRVIGLTEGTQNTLARRSQIVVPYAANERGFWNTKSFLVSLSLALAIGGGLAGRADLAPHQWLTRLSGLLSEVLARLPESVASTAAVVAGSSLVLLVSRGHLIGVAQNAAVDLQEGLRLAAIAVSGGLLRHGPIELTLRPDAAAVVLIPSDSTASRMARAVADMADQGGRVVALVAGEIEVPGVVKTVRLPPSEPELSPMIFAVALQLINVAVARRLGVSTISPVSITKVTRVE